MSAYRTPILFLIFNRPDLTSIVFEEIRKQKPKYLFVAADGPRDEKTGENEKCEFTRNAVINNIDWNCEVKTLFRNTNLGCGLAVSEAISWFFENVEEGIILEDDCLPDPSFFSYCQELLAKYKDNDAIMHIGGANFQKFKATKSHSYYFSNYIHVWGWATWRRSWKMYTFNLQLANNQLEELLIKKFPYKIEREYWIKSFSGMAKHSIDTWDIQWVHTIFTNAGMGITPTMNLISNIGFGSEATHTHMFDVNSAELSLNSIGQIKHPPKIKISRKADQISFKKLFQGNDTFFNRTKFKIGQKIPIVKTIFLKIFH